MISLLLIGGLFTLLALVLLNSDWRSGLLITIAIGFLQDPIRKLTPNQPGLFVGLALVAFLACGVVLLQQRGGRFELHLMLRSAPGSLRLLSMFIALVVLQGFNSVMRWGIPLRTAIGIGFYIAPIAGLWMGFQVGRDQFFLRRLLRLYLVFCCVYATTTFLDYRGLDIPLFDAVAGGQIIHFRYGFYTSGAVGLWRSTDIAAWHLCAGACLAVVFAVSGRSALGRNSWLAAAASLALVSLFTGRRKAITQVVVFLGIFFWLLSRYGGGSARRQLASLLITAAGMAAVFTLLDPSEFLGSDFSEYTQRASTTGNALLDRFNILGVNALRRGLEISGGIGLGAGTLAQTGAANVALISGVSFSYVSESGLGKIAAELGIPGLLVLPPLLIGLGLAVIRSMRMLRSLPLSVSSFELGLVAFAISNIPFFSAAAGVYGDPFILLICGICLGSVLSTQSLLSQQPRQGTIQPLPTATIAGAL